MPAGRPTKLTPEIIEAAKGYLDNYEAAGDAFPNVAGLSIAINITRTTVYDWAKEKDSEFSYIVADVMAKQEQVLWKNGMSGEFNASLTKLALTKHNYSDRQELTGNDGGPLEFVQSLMPTTGPPSER